MSDKTEEDPRRAYGPGEMPRNLANMFLAQLKQDSVDYKAMKHKTPGISSEEVERRRKMVRSAFRSNAMEGLRPNPACQPVFDAYIAGEIELDELGRRIDAVLGLRR